MNETGNYRQSQEVDRGRFLLFFKSLMQGSDFKLIAPDVIREVCEIYSLALPTPSPKDQPEGQKEQELRFTFCSGNRACDEFVIHMEDNEGKQFKTILGGKFARLVFQADIIRKGAACRKMLEELLESWSDEWTEATTERVRQTIKSAKNWTKETSSPASEAGMSQSDFDRQRKYKPFTGEEIGTIGYNPESGDLRIEPYSFYCVKPSDIPCEQQCDRCKKVSPPQPSEPAPTEQGEIPEEIEEWIEKMAIDVANGPFAHENAAAKEGAKRLYHKMQEEIQEYRKALDDWRKFDPQIHSLSGFALETTELLAKYPNS